MPSTEDTNLVENGPPATQINTVTNLELANQTGQNAENSGNLSGVTSPMGTPENKREEEQVSDGKAVNDDPREGDATTEALAAKTRPEQKRKFEPNA